MNFSAVGKSIVAAAGVVLALACGLPGPAQAGSAPARPSWIVPELLEAAKAEGGLTVYSSTNEQEGLPLWKLFEDATGIKVNYLRSTDANITGRIAIENRANQRSWDLVQITAVNKLPESFLLQYEPPEATNLDSRARDPNRRWYGVYANYHAPACNTNLLKEENLPKSFEEFATRKDLAGKVAIDGSDTEWLKAMFLHYGEERASKLIQEMVANLKPVVTDGHLALARAVGTGEYAALINNYVVLTLNVKLGAAPSDFWALDPVALNYGQVGINAQAPHPKSAQLATNFLLSKETQEFQAKKGRLPTRKDVESNPPGVIAKLEQKKVIPTVLSAEEERVLRARFNELFKPR